MNFIHSSVKMKETVSEYHDNKAKSTPIAMVAPEVKQNADDTEITKTCAVSGCEDYKALDADSFFRFPEEPKLRQIWTDLTGRNNWTPTDYSYICIHHFSVDSFVCNADNNVVLTNEAVPSQKLPKHVLEVEYIDEDSLDNEASDSEDMELDEEDETGAHTINGNISTNIDNKKEKSIANESEVPSHSKNILRNNRDKNKINLEVLNLFTEVQKMQRQAAVLREKVKRNTNLHSRQKRYLAKLRELIEIKKNVLIQRRKKKSKILLSIQDKIKEDRNGLVLAMPTRHTDDLKNFSLSIYKYSPHAYIYIRNTLRTMLPSTDVLDSWVNAGYQPKNVLTNSNLIKVISELNESELSCKISLR